MSELTHMLMKERIKFVIPYASKLRYVTIGKKDRALAYCTDKGYIETYNMDACYYLSLFLKQTQTGKFIEVGNIEKIRLKDSTFVYRQRLYFTSLPLLIKIIGHFQGKIIIPESFKIGIQQMSYCARDIKNLEKYFNLKGFKDCTLDDWLTDCCLLQMHILADMNNIALDAYKSFESLAVEGILNRAPYLSGIYDISEKRSSLIVPPKDYLMLSVNNEIIDLTRDKLEKCRGTVSRKYVVSDGNDTIPIYGFTAKNLEFDKEYL